MEEFVVIGAGLAGAATAWQLAARGHEVTILERTTPGNRAGSSHGSARIFRYAYSNRMYADLVVRARRGWEEIERLSETSLITPTGSIDHGALRPVRRIAAVLEQVGVDHQLLTAREAAGRWPQLRFDTDVLWHPDAGVLDAISTVEALLGLATATGRARLLSDWPVTRVLPVPGGYRVLGPDGDSVDSRSVVVAAGGWLPELLSELSLPSAFVASCPPLDVRQEQVVHFPYGTDATGQVPEWPSFIYRGEDMHAYGLPGGRDAGCRGQKVAQFNGGRSIGSASNQDGIVDPAARERLIEFARDRLPGVIAEPYAETTCLFTNTPSEDFVFDRVDGITIVSPCSGHGGKFAPLIGEFAADLALGTGDVPAQFRVAAHAVGGGSAS